MSVSWSSCLSWQLLLNKVVAFPFIGLPCVSFVIVVAAQELVEQGARQVLGRLAFLMYLKEQCSKCRLEDMQLTGSLLRQEPLLQEREEDRRALAAARF